MAGGRRRGAGRDPGSEMTKQSNRNGSANLVHGYGQTNTAKSSTRSVKDHSVPDGEQHLMGLQPHVQTMLRMIVRNKSKTDIQDEMNISRPTLESYIDRFPLAVLEASLEVAGGPDELMRPLLPKVMRTYDDLLEQRADLAVRGIMARDVMDRVFGKPVVRAQVESIQPVNVQFIDLVADEVTDVSSTG